MNAPLSEADPSPANLDIAPLVRLAERCETCRFWKPIQSGLGMCRLVPPVVCGDETLWPTTEPSDWCGEFDWAPNMRPPSPPIPPPPPPLRRG